MSQNANGGCEVSTPTLRQYTPEEMVKKRAEEAKKKEKKEKK